MEVFMEIRVHSLKFDADQKLLDFIEKKVSKISRFDTVNPSSVCASISISMIRSEPF